MRYPEGSEYLQEKWEEGDLLFSILCHSHYCGYVRFPRRPVREESYKGILTYVPVHGGITYAKEDDAGMVYGFDCGHYADEGNSETRDFTWLRRQCRIMSAGVSVAAHFEEEYLAVGNEQKAEVLDAYHKRLKEDYGYDFDLVNNFGAMISALMGEL